MYEWPLQWIKRVGKATEVLKVSIGHSLHSLRCQLGVLCDFAELLVGVLFPDGQEFGFLGSSCRGQDHCGNL